MTPDPTLQQSQRNRLGDPAWLPIPLFLVTMIVLWAADLRTAYESPYLLMALNFVFSTLVSLFIAYLIGRSFLARRMLGLLMLGSGVMVWGAAGLVGVAVGFLGNAGGQFDSNVLVTIHNTSVWLSALCYFTGAVLSLRARRGVHVAGLSLAAAYTLALAAVGLVAMAAHAGWMPIFFVQGHGGTPLRQVVLASAIAMFIITASLLWAGSRKSFSRFAYWYAIALALIAVGLFGVMMQPSAGSLLGWTGRAAQFLSGVYMLIAAIASVRESRAWEIPLEDALRQSEGVQAGDTGFTAGTCGRSR